MFSYVCAQVSNPSSIGSIFYLLFNDDRPLFLLTPSGAASLQEFIIRVGDAKSTKEDGDSLLGCAKVCNNVSVFTVLLRKYARFYF